MSNGERLTLHSDGGARGNPGPAGIGFAIARDGKIICRGGSYLGETTNNIAEYKAFIWGLENALDLKATAIDAFADSELMVKQIAGAYKVKNEALKPLFAQAKELMASFPGGATLTHVRREYNKDADDLANQAMDARDDVGDFLCPPLRETLF